ncbi:MAG: cyclic nucleotide-binding domain-containing protein [Ferruginibacter sp.]
MEEIFKMLFTICPVSDKLIEYMALNIQSKQLHKKDFLLKAGHICHQLCFVEKGLLRCFYLNGETEICSWFMKEGDMVISIESFYQQKPSYESIQAVEDTVVYSIGHSQIMFMYHNFSESNMLGRVLTEKYYQLWAQQLYALRMKQAPERYKWLMENHGELILRVPAKYLASYLGITEGTLSTIKGSL